MSALSHWLLLWTLDLATELEEGVGEPEIADRYRRQAGELAPLAHAAFWDDERGLYRDGPESDAFSELVQAMAVLSGRVPPASLRRLAESLVSSEKLKRASVHGSYYVMEAARALGLTAFWFDRLELWKEMKELGLRTPLESREPSRSDCHAWGSSPLYQYFATVLGIRPAAPGFRRVAVTPVLGPLPEASGRLVHPGGGEIAVSVRREGSALRGRVELPDGLGGTLELPTGETRLGPGTTEF